jgi:hypothetical protein
MTKENPDLQRLLRRMTEIPAAFLQPPSGASMKGCVCTPALVQDTLLHMGYSLVSQEVLKAFIPGKGLPASEESRFRLIQVVCWLVHDPWFFQQKAGMKLLTLFSGKFTDFAALVTPEKVIQDEERREELVRFCLKHFAGIPEGETLAQCEDRWQTLDSVERARVIRAARQAEQRARQIREEMERKRAAEAASTYGHE